MLLLPLITLAVGANFVELDYNVQVGHTPKAVQIAVQDTRLAHQSPWPARTLPIIPGLRIAQGFQFAATAAGPWPERNLPIIPGPRMMIGRVGAGAHTLDAVGGLHIRH